MTVFSLVVLFDRVGDTCVEVGVSRGLCRLLSVDAVAVAHVHAQ